MTKPWRILILIVTALASAALYWGNRLQVFVGYLALQDDIDEYISPYVAPVWQVIREWPAMEYMAFLVLISSLLAIVWVIFEVPLKQFFAGLIKADTKVFPVECVFGRLELIPDCDAAAPRMFIVHRVRMTNKTSEPAHLSAVLALRFNMEISKGEGEAYFRATDTGRDEYERVLQSNAQYRFIPMPLHLEAKRTVSGELAFLMPEWRAPMWAPNPDLKPNVVRRRTDELRSIDAALEITDFLSGSRVVVELPGKHVP